MSLTLGPGDILETWGVLEAPHVYINPVPIAFALPMQDGVGSTRSAVTFKQCIHLFFSGICIQPGASFISVLLFPLALSTRSEGNKTPGWFSFAPHHLKLHFSPYIQHGSKPFIMGRGEKRGTSVLFLNR